MQREDKKIPEQNINVKFMGSSDNKIEYMTSLSEKNYGFIDNFDCETRHFSYDNYAFWLTYVPYEDLIDANAYNTDTLIICPTSAGEIARIYEKNLSQDSIKNADIYVVVNSSLLPEVLKVIEEEAFSLGMEVREEPNPENREKFLDDIIKTSQLSNDERKKVHQDNIKEYKEFKEGPQRRAIVSDFFKSTAIEDPAKIINDYVGGAKENKR